MSNRSSHVDVNERRLRPIYDCLDSGNNKKAVQEADRLLKKQKDFPCAKALRSLAIIRLGRQDEVLSTLHEVHSQHPSDEHTLQAMAMCYRDVNRLDLLAEMYENAHRSKPDSEEILNSLFMAYVRLGLCKKQQQIAMQLHKLRPMKNPYYFWAVMSIVMQAHGDKKLGPAMYLPLAEKMTLKYIQEGKLEAEAEVRLYLIILQCLNKHQETLDVLHGPLAAKLTSEPDFPQHLEGEVLKKLGRWPEVNSLYRKLLVTEADHWLYYGEYFNSLFELIKVGWTPPQDVTDNNTGDAGDVTRKVDYTVELAVDFIKSQVESDVNQQLRGPLLAQLELMRLLRQRDDGRWQTLFDSPAELFKKYFCRFGEKPCCYNDLQLFTCLLDETHLQQLLNEQLNQLGLGFETQTDTKADNEQQFIVAEDPKLMQRHISLLQLLRRSGEHKLLTVDNKLELISTLHRHYTGGLHLGDHLLSTDLQYVDSYVLLLSHLLYDIYSDTRDEAVLWQAAQLLEAASDKSPANFQFKLLLIQLYAKLGAIGACFAVYERMDVKHIQHDSLGYLLTNHALRLGHLTRAEVLFDLMLKFFATVQKDTSDYLISSYKYGAFPKVNEFVQFKERLLHSLQFASATVEKLLLDITRQSSHKVLQEVVSSMDVDPLAEKTDFDAVRDNRDCRVIQAWDTDDRAFTDAMKLASFTEEKCWLQLRNLIARVLISAGRVSGPPMEGHPSAPAALHSNVPHTASESITDALRNGDQRSGQSAALEAVNQLTAELQLVLSQLSEQYGNTDLSQVPLLVGPFRTRLCPYLRLGVGEHLVQVLHLLTHLGAISDDLIKDKLDCKTIELPDTSRLKFLSGVVVENISRLSSVDHNDSHKLLNVEAVENLVLVVEHMCHVAVVMGACHAVLKPIKLSTTRRSKKRKETDPRISSVCNEFSVLVTELSDVCKQLLNAFEQLAVSTDGPLIERFKTLAFTESNNSYKALQAALGTTSESNVVAERIRFSYQQTTNEMTTALKFKLEYLQGLHF